MPKQKPESKKVRSAKSIKTESKKQTSSTIPSTYKLLRNSFLILWQDWRTVGLILIIYLALTLLFSSGLASSSIIHALKENLINSSHSDHSSISTGFSLFGSLVSSSLSSSITNGGAQTMLFVIFSIVIIWLLRYLYLGKHPKARDALYKSLYPLIPFFLVLLIIFSELIPAFIGAYLYSLIFNNGIAVSSIEKIAWIGLCLALALASLYLIFSSIFALYIVTLPDMRPIKSIRSSWTLVKQRRSIIFSKIFLLPVILTVAVGTITLLFVIIIPDIADWIFLALIISCVAVAHSYMYALYRELI